ncbi:DUF6090 family protein [Winogradskyella aquimaris]|uniref:DUF6090 family protein n=1 Tax=Winogradskyella aquimaris TaxID=864074 RepID=A0ABU5ERR2_9FLAO|nr:DUF6090 family protein [Winogradskyella aquimaris]MDY2587551.1 DUF6090 family protein [Winogradskyella aquimaris]
MIKFFRHIRKSLLEQNKMGKYFKYAIGEIILVVIGILIALQINNWNEERKDSYEEQKILVQLKNEFEKNLDQLNEKIYMRNKMTLASEGLLNYIDNPEIIVKDSLLYYIFRLTQEPTFDPIENDLAVSGKLRMIKNDSLKILLSNWTSDAYQVQELEASWQQVRNDVVIPIFIEKDFARNTIAYLLNNGYTPDHAFNKSTQLNYHITPNNVDLVHALNDSSKELQGAASSCILFNKITNGQSVALRDRIEKILSLIQSELNND